MLTPTVHLLVTSPVPSTEGQFIIQPTLEPTPTPTATAPAPSPEPLFDPKLSLTAGPVYVPLELQIPSLHVKAPMLGVGITREKAMAAPTGPIDSPNWHTAFWYRGGSIPGEVGTATIAGHVNNSLGRPEIFSHLSDLIPGDLIIVHFIKTNVDISFTVNFIYFYSIQDEYDPVVLKLIYGIGPVEGTGPQPAPDGLSHLTLITCSGAFVDGQFNHRTVIYATRSN
jgi:hypothetical protein